MSVSWFQALIVLAIFCFAVFFIYRLITRKTSKAALGAPLSGVGGWLAWLVFAFLILGPLAQLAGALKFFDTAEGKYPQLTTNSHWLEFKYIHWIIVAVSITISIWAGYRLWKVYFPESVRFGILALWLCGPVTFALEILAFGFVFGAHALSAFASASLGPMVGSLFAAALWTTYLVVSVRVDNTYRRVDGLSRRESVPDGH